MPDIAPVNMQKTKCHFVFSVNSRSGTPKISRFPEWLCLVGEPYYTTIVKTSTTLQFCLYGYGAGNGTYPGCRCETSTHLVFPRVRRTSFCMTIKTAHIKVVKIETCQSGTTFKHLSHIIYVGCVEVVKIDTGQAATTPEHYLHTRNIGSVEVGDIDTGQVAALREHTIHIRDIGSVKVGEIDAGQVAAT